MRQSKYFVRADKGVAGEAQAQINSKVGRNIIVGAHPVFWI